MFIGIALADPATGSSDRSLDLLQHSFGLSQTPLQVGTFTLVHALEIRTGPLDRDPNRARIALPFGVLLLELGDHPLCSGQVIDLAVTGVLDLGELAQHPLDSCRWFRRTNHVPASGFRMSGSNAITRPIGSDADREGVGEGRGGDFVGFLEWERACALQTAMRSDKSKTQASRSNKRPNTPTVPTESGLGGRIESSPAKDTKPGTTVSLEISAVVAEEGYRRPPLELFAEVDPEHGDQSDADRELVAIRSARLETVLRDFRICGKVVGSNSGPVVTCFLFVPEAGVKLSRIESLEHDIAMALEAKRVRIVAPIPGTAFVGIEVPNRTRKSVSLREVLETDDFGEGKQLPIALGKDITGRAVSADLTQAPHLLVAGATGSGKSVGINAMICSLLYARAPEDVRLILIDLKMLELSIYEGVPHLLLPVVTECDKAEIALRWVVAEMERRYAILSAAQVRDINAYNRKLPELQAQWNDHSTVSALLSADERTDSPRGERPTKLPFLVVVIDEFADLMIVASKAVETCVARIAAKARAAGIHLIIATQRPSVDVITGTIKNNFPSRIAFQVTAEADSRTILDGKGAKQLVGTGDMLHMDRGREAQRVQGCFVSEEEILRLVEFVRRQARPTYNLDILREPSPEAELDPLYLRAVETVAEAGKVSVSMLQRELRVGYGRASKLVEAMRERGVVGAEPKASPHHGLDELFDQAVDLVATERKASTSMLQRRLGVGYNRAARLIETMETRGIVGPPRGATFREVLVTA